MNKVFWAIKWCGLTGLLSLCFAQLADASSARMVRPKPADATGMYEESTTDMSVKYAGGTLRVERLWANGRWTFNANWADLQFFRDARVRTMSGGADGGDGSGSIMAPNLSVSGGRGFGLAGDATGLDAPSAILAIRRNVSKYTQSPTNGRLYIYSNAKRIIRTETGEYRWENERGQWIRYSSDGRAQAFGDQTEHTITLERDGAGRIERAVDNQGTVLLSYTYDSAGRPLTLTDYSGRTVTYHWEGGQLTRVTDVRGYDWQYTYQNFEEFASTHKGIATKTDPLGRVTTFHHEILRGGVECINQPPPDSTNSFPTFSSDGSGGGSIGSIAGHAETCGGYTLSGLKILYMGNTDSMGIIEQHRFYFDGEKKQYQTETFVPGRGVRREIADVRGKPLGTEINGQLLYKLEVAENERSQVHTDNNGLTSTKLYDEFGRLTRITHTDGSSQSWEYYGNDLVQRYTNERGIVTEATYYANGKLHMLTEAVGTDAERVTEFEYTTSAHPSVMRQLGDGNTQEAVTQWSNFDAYGNPRTQIDPEGIETRYTYDAMGNVLTYRDGRGNTWTRAFDGAGNLTRETDPLGHFSEYTYDEVGNLRLVTDAMRQPIATYTYNDRNSITSITNAYGHVKVFIYDIYNRLRSVRNEIGGTATITYDEFGRPDVITDPAGNTSQILYGTANEKLVNPLAKFYQPSGIRYPTFTEYYNYDRRYRLSTIRRVLAENDERVTQYQYDAAGNQIRMVDPADRAWVYGYDELDRLEVTTDPDQFTTRYVYDDRDNLLTFTNELNIPLRVFAYNRRNEQVLETWPTGNAFEYRYDNNGNLDRKVDGKLQIQRHFYDIANRLERSDYFANAQAETENIVAKSTSFSYNDANSITGYNDGTFSGTYAFDNMQRLLSETVNYGSFSRAHSYTYTPTGKKRTFTNPDGSVNTYGYDNADRLTQIAIPGQGNITINKYKWMAPEEITLPGGTKQTNTYDPLMRIENIHVQDPAENTLMNYGYQYDAAGNITDKVTQHGAYSYGYDDLDRLTSSLNPTLDNEIYTYDATGNRLTAAETGEVQWVYDNSNQLQSAGPNQSYGYDANGSMNTRTVDGITQNFVYNLENRLSEVRDAQNTLVAQYHYDPFGRRVAKTVGSETTFFQYADEGMIAELDSAGNTLQGYGFQPGGIWGTDPVFTKAGSAVSYYLNDHLGTPQKMVNGSGQTTWAMRASAFGVTEVDTAATMRNPLRFAGQYEDEETGDFYNWKRTYSAGVGRYIQSDPIGLGDGPNTYSYVRGNPLRGIDPNGEWAILVAPALRALIFVGACYATGACQSISDGFEELIRPTSNPSPWDSPQFDPMPKPVPDVPSPNHYHNEECDNKRQENPDKADSPVWNDPGLTSAGNGRKTNGKRGKKREYYEWDHTHNDIEVYDGKGKHKGSRDPVTGEDYKPKVPGRRIDI